MTMLQSEPFIEVGILHHQQIEFALNGEFLLNGTDEIVPGYYKAIWTAKGILFRGEVFDALSFTPMQYSNSFDLYNVTIGIQFHWEREEKLCFPGELKVISDGKEIWAINRVLLETYLASVISSEMKATASTALLQAHAVISRSWLLAQLAGSQKKKSPHLQDQASDEIIRWFDREDHLLFDVCADDHCQRYQGITRVSAPQVTNAVQYTRGEVLMYDGEICDARFSKCCGGISERFENCWEDMPHPYLVPVYDREDESLMPHLVDEREAENFIRNLPEAFCNTVDESILNQVLNNYDRETPDFYRWQIKYTQKEIASIIKNRLNTDLGDILDLKPLFRGDSGRIIRLQIVGSYRSIVIGKELMIRRTLSPTHLYSSAFVVDKEVGFDGIPVLFTLTGAGWGHGVGLCQIGAAVMGSQGYTYNQILSHYFKHAELKKIY